MRILILTNLYPNPYQPRRAPFNRQQFQSLAARHPTAVIAPISWLDELAARRKNGVRLPADRRVTYDAIPVEHPRYVYPPRVLRGWYGHCFRRSVAPAFERALNDFRPDVVVGSWAFPDGWAAVELGQRAGLPVLLKVHGCDVLRLDGFSAGRRRRTVDALRRADGIVAVSRNLAERAVALGVEPRRVRIVYNGVDSGLFHPGPAAAARARLRLETSDPLVLFVGNLELVKGPDVLVEACARIAREGVRFQCAMIGEGPLKPKLERRIAEHGLEGRVELLGPRPLEKLPDWYRAAGVFVLPSRSEGVPNVLLEAAACGASFVASHVGGVPEIAHLGVGRLVPPGEPEPLAEAIRDGIARPSLERANAAAPIRSHAEAAAELASFLEEIVRTRTGTDLARKA